MKFIIATTVLTFTMILFVTNACTQQLKPTDSVTNKHEKIVSNYSLRNDISRFQDEKWDTLAQPLFWKRVMSLSKDTVLINIAKTRQIIEIMTEDTWLAKTSKQKTAYKDSIKLANKMLPTDDIFVTSGKSDFYQFQNVLENIEKSTAVFVKDSVDPWYAQAILMIESPGSLAKSNVGAYGPFQLMRGVALQMGMTVNSKLDEREDLEKSAFGAAKLIKTICLPYARNILFDFNVPFNENETWFRLFVLHVYHAGAGNVRKVVSAINPSCGGQALIKTMWQTSAGAFGNSSQNYSQLALAAQMIFHRMVAEKPEFMN